MFLIVNFTIGLKKLEIVFGLFLTLLNFGLSLTFYFEINLKNWVY